MLSVGVFFVFLVLFREGRVLLLLPPPVVEGGTDGGTELRVFRYSESYAVELLHGREYLAALGQEGEIANHHEVLDARFQRREDGGRTDALQYHADESHGDVLARCIRLGIAEERSRGSHRKARQRLGADVAYQEVDLRDVTVLRQVDDLLDVIGLQHDAAQSCQGSASDAYSADVLDVVDVLFIECCWV